MAFNGSLCEPRRCRTQASAVCRLCRGPTWLFNQGQQPQLLLEECVELKLQPQQQGRAEGALLQLELHVTAGGCVPAMVQPSAPQVNSSAWCAELLRVPEVTRQRLCRQPMAATAVTKTSRARCLLQ